MWKCWSRRPFHILCFTGVNSAPGVTLSSCRAPDFYMVSSRSCRPELCLLRAPMSLPFSLRLRMWNLTYLVEPGSIAVTWRERNLNSLKWGNETLLFLSCYRAQDLRMPSCFSQRFWMDDVQALPYIEWKSCSYFARLNAIGQFSLAWFNKASVVFEEKVFPIAMSRSLISGNRGYESNSEHYPSDCCRMHTRDRRGSPHRVSLSEWEL